MSKRYYIRVKWNGVMRNLEYVPIRYLADQRLILVRAFEYWIKGKPVVMMEVRRNGESAITRTIRWGMKLSAFKHMLQWNGVDEVPIAYIKRDRNLLGESSEQANRDVGAESTEGAEEIEGEHGRVEPGHSMDEQGADQTADRANPGNDRTGATPDLKYEGVGDEP